MHLMVRSINFRENAISLDVDRSIKFVHFEHLASFVGFCGDLGFSAIDIHYPARLPLTSFALLKKLGNTPGFPALSLASHEGEPSFEASDPRRFACVGRYLDRKHSIEYRFSSRDMSIVLDDLTTTVLLVGYSIPLDEESLGYLRLCLYELGANTVEHGDFDHGGPEIRVTLVVRDDRIEIEYSDNAEAFSTSNGRDIDVADMIKQRSKRGLGLFMLKKIAEELSYRRESTWNHTRFGITRGKEALYDLNRRTDMNDLSITVTRTDCREIAVLKPSGSINSSTVAQLDSSFNALLRNGQNTIALDLSETEFISSSGVGLLLGTVSSLREKNGDLVLMNVPKLIDDILDVLNIKMHFRMIKDLNELKVGAKP
jgi:anti-anti-sigma factor